ncbi:unnamed protein product [Rhizophagus irregularis]|nr:unnamed protein product [Rhizophagus irregularis]
MLKGISEGNVILSLEATFDWANSRYPYVVDKKCFTLMSVNQITYPVADEVGIRYKELVVRPLQYAYLYYISVLNIALETILKKVNSEDYIEILLTWITAPQNKETRY